VTVRDDDGKLGRTIFGTEGLVRVAAGLGAGGRITVRPERDGTEGVGRDGVVRLKLGTEGLVRETEGLGGGGRTTVTPEREGTDGVGREGVLRLKLGTLDGRGGETERLR
jgi:hypothetical protein